MRCRLVYLGAALLITGGRPFEPLHRVIPPTSPSASCPLFTLAGPRIKALYGVPGISMCSPARAASGEVASGVIADEREGRELYLDIHPCNRALVGFTRPYRKEPSGTVMCRGQEVEAFVVEQLPKDSGANRSP